jgi:RNA polymerase sigma-70 factor (ECF subfamily)
MNFYRHYSLCIGKEDAFVCAHDEIFKLFIKGDRQAMSKLVETYKRELFNLCFRLTFNKQDAEDLFQQTWIKATKNASRYEHQSFKPWLFKICVNQYRDNYRQYLKRKKLMKEDFESTSAKDYVLTTAGGTDSVEEQFEKKHIQALIIANIDKLPQPQKVPMVLYYYQQMKYSEIAGVLGVPEGTVKSRINTAKKKLKSVLESELYV